MTKLTSSSEKFRDLSLLFPKDQFQTVESSSSSELISFFDLRPGRVIQLSADIGPELITSWALRSFLLKLLKVAGADSLKVHIHEKGIIKSRQFRDFLQFGQGLGLEFRVSSNSLDAPEYWTILSSMIPSLHLIYDRREHSTEILTQASEQLKSLTNLSITIRTSRETISRDYVLAEKLREMISQVDLISSDDVSLYEEEFRQLLSSSENTRDIIRISSEGLLTFNEKPHGNIYQGGAIQFAEEVK